MELKKPDHSVENIFKAFGIEEKRIKHIQEKLAKRLMLDQIIHSSMNDTRFIEIVASLCQSKEELAIMSFVLGRNMGVEKAEKEFLFQDREN